MVQSNQRQRKPTGALRWLLRAPIQLYQAGLGGLLGHRFLLLTHIGRRSGQQRETVLEITGYDEGSDTYYVAAGFGSRSDWYLNLQTTPSAVIQVGRRRIAVQARLLDGAESGERMVIYAREHPYAVRELCRVLGLPAVGTIEGYRQLGEDHLPFVALYPQQILDEAVGIWPGWLLVALGGMLLARWWRERQQALRDLSSTSS